MSTCSRCGGNPCYCCEHRLPPGKCVACASIDTNELRERVDALEEKVAALETALAGKCSHNANDTFAYCKTCGESLP